VFTFLVFFVHIVHLLSWEGRSLLQVSFTGLFYRSLLQVSFTGLDQVSESETVSRFLLHVSFQTHKSLLPHSAPGGSTHYIARSDQISKRDVYGSLFM